MSKRMPIHQTAIAIPSPSPQEGPVPLVSPSLDEIAAQLDTLTRRVEQVESMSHTDHTLSPAVIEHIATTAVTKMVTHFSTLLKMGETLLHKDVE